jgi:hypothetical protein
VALRLGNTQICRCFRKTSLRPTATRARRSSRLERCIYRRR